MSAPSRRAHIQSLATQVSELSRELDRLLRIEDTGQPPVPPPAVPPPAVPRPPREPFVVGSRVRITNNYRGLRGQEGVVTRVTRVFIFLRLDSGRVTSRQRSNLLILSQAQ